MKLTPTKINSENYPKALHPFLNSPLYDSSCSPEARVIYIQKDQGYFLKIAPKKALEKEVKLTRYFFQKAFAPEIILYLSEEKDYMLTAKVLGNDCTDPRYLEDPKRLCDLLSQQLLNLHLTSFEDCPVPNHTKSYLETARRNYESQKYDLNLFFDSFSYKTPNEAYKIVQNHHKILKNDTLLHGDYCLPNIIFDNWKFSSFVDLDSAGVGDRHVDIFWALWTLKFNLKTDKLRQRFIDGYGKHLISEESLNLISAIEVFG